MPRVCTICTHAERSEIDAALVRGESFRHIAAQFRVSTTALQRHKAEHVPVLLLKSKEAQELVHADNLLDQLSDLQTTTLRLLSAAEAAKKYTPAILAVGQARQNLELLGKLLHQLDEHPVVNVWMAPEWLSLQSKIINALDRHPEAKSAVLMALAEGDDGHH